MVSWSALRTIYRGIPTSNTTALILAKRPMSEHRTFPLAPSRFQWKKFKDLFHFYLCIGLIPAGLIIIYCNVFIGPATLQDIPDGYVPKHYEYYRHPITRFIARYVMNSPQEDYEKYLHHLYVEGEKREIRFLTDKIQEKMKERDDYQAYYYRPVLGKYHRVTREVSDYLDSIRSP